MPIEPTKMTESLSFDRAADFYDATRALREEAIAALTDALAREIRAAQTDTVLEIGVGTGRIARPLAERGIRVCGVDISPLMMRRLAEQLGPQHTAPNLLLADATHLPFRDASFRAALASHVLHLIPAWQQAVAELLRVLQPGGVLLSTYAENEGPSDWDASGDKWKQLLNARGYAPRRRRADNQSIPGALAAGGGTSRTETLAVWDEESSPAEEIDLQRKRIHSWNWEIPDDVYFACFPEFERWALEHYGDLQRPLRRRAAQRLQVWRFS